MLKRDVSLNTATEIAGLRPQTVEHPYRTRVLASTTLELYNPDLPESRCFIGGTQ
jgi:hypothetical protein